MSTNNISSVTSRYSSLCGLVRYVNLMAACFAIITSYNYKHVKDFYNQVAYVFYDHEQQKWYCVLEETSAECPDFSGISYKWDYAFMFYIFTCVLVYLFV